MPGSQDPRYIPTDEEAHRAAQTLADWVRLSDHGTPASRFQFALHQLGRFARIQVSTTILDGATGEFTRDAQPPPN